MREIKYKAYWNESKVMTSVDTIEFLNGGTRVSDGCAHTGWAGRDCELVQFTGLKDKNDIEIYEGDIVRYSGNNGSDNYQITFAEGCFITRCITTPGNWNDDPLTANSLDFENHWKVIGNRYENPELMED